MTKSLRMYNRMAACIIQFADSYYSGEDYEWSSLLNLANELVQCSEKTNSGSSGDEKLIERVIGLRDDIPKYNDILSVIAEVSLAMIREERRQGLNRPYPPLATAFAQPTLAT